MSSNLCFHLHLKWLLVGKASAGEVQYYSVRSLQLWAQHTLLRVSESFTDTVTIETPIGYLFNNGR